MLPNSQFTNRKINCPIESGIEMPTRNFFKKKNRVRMAQMMCCNEYAAVVVVGVVEHRTTQEDTTEISLGKISAYSTLEGL